MEVVETFHFGQRVKRRAKKPEGKVREAFKEAVTLMKKKKLHPKRGYKEWTHCVTYGGHTFIFCKENGTYFLITYYLSAW